MWGEYGKAINLHRLTVLENLKKPGRKRQDIGSVGATQKEFLGVGGGMISGNGKSG